MYSVRLRSGARHGETPIIGGNPKNQPISELDIFSKRQALSRAVVVNSNMSRGKYLAREGPGSRLIDQVPCQLCLTTSLLATDGISYMRDHASSLLFSREEPLFLSSALSQSREQPWPVCNRRPRLRLIDTESGKLKATLAIVTAHSRG